MSNKVELSPYNFVPEVTSDFDFTGEVTICDSTIRKMDVTPGSKVPYPVADKLEIAAVLDEMGVRIVGCNPTHYYGTARNKSITDGVRAIAKRGFNFELLGGQFGIFKLPQKVREERVEWVADMGLNIMTITIGGSESRRQLYGTDMTLQQLADEAVGVMEYAKKRGMKSGPMFADSARGDLDQLIPVINFFVGHGADIVGLVDTYGALSPQGTRYFLKRINRGLTKRVPILYHAHDDFGMATAIATAAALEGCIPDVAVNGVGDRGFADLAQVVVSLELLYGGRTGLRLEKLTEVSRMVERITGIPMQPHRPVTGTAQYVPHASSGYINLLNGRPSGTGAYEPELVGQRPRLVWWEGMATAVTVEAKLKHMGLPRSDREVGRALDAIEERLLELKEFPAWLDDNEVSEMCRKAVATAVPAD